MKCKWEGEHRGHNSVDLSESREAMKASLEDCAVGLESYRSALREIPETATEWVTEDDGCLRRAAELVISLIRDPEFQEGKEDIQVALTALWELVLISLNIQAYAISKGVIPTILTIEKSTSSAAEAAYRLLSLPSSWTTRSTRIFSHATFHFFFLCPVASEGSNSLVAISFL